jgi:hypothetical protein
MTPAVWAGIDELHVSLYPGYHLSLEEREVVDEAGAEHEVEVTWKQFDYFRESYSERGTSDFQLVRQIFDTCQIAHVWRCHNVAGGWFFKCPQSYFLPRILEPDRAEPIDGLRLSGDSDLGTRLLAFLVDDRPLHSCRNCLGSVGRRFPHEQVARLGFRPQQQAPTEELLDRSHLRTLANDPDVSNACVTRRASGGRVAVSR